MLNVLKDPKEFKNKKEWAINTINSIDSTFSNITTYRDSRQEIIDNVQLAKYGHFDTGDFNNLFSAFEIDNEFKHPASLTHYDIIKPILNLLVGEEINRPFNYRAINKTSGAVSSVKEEYGKLIYEGVLEFFAYQVKAKMAQQDPESQQQTPPEPPTSLEAIQEYAKANVSDIAERTANAILEYTAKDQNLKYKFKEGFFNYLSSRKEIYHVDVINGKINVRLVDPIYFESDLPEDVGSIEYASWIREEETLPINQVIERYSQYLTDEDIKELVENVGRYQLDYPLYNRVNLADYNYQRSSEHYVRVAHFEWKTIKEIAIVDDIDEEGNLITYIEYDEKEIKKLKKKKDAIILKIPETWEGIKIGSSATMSSGNAIYINVQPIPDQYSSINHIGKHYSRYVGIQTPYCVVDSIKYYQYLYNVVWFKIKNLLATAKGNIMLMDTKLIPTEDGWNMQKWLDVVDSTHIAWIDSSLYESNGGGWFNQLQQIGLGLDNNIQFYLMVLNELKIAIQQATGINEQRKGQTSPYETASNMERSVINSSAITEELFYNHDYAKRQVLEKILELAKSNYVQNPNVEMIFDDVQFKFLELDLDKFKFSDFGIFINSYYDDNRQLRALQEAAKMALQTGSITLEDFAECMSTSSAFKIKGVLQKADQKQQQRQQEQQQMQAQMQMQLEQAKQQAELQKLELEYKLKLEIEKLKSDTDLEKARITGEGFTSSRRADLDLDRNDNSILDIREINPVKGNGNIGTESGSTGNPNGTRTGTAQRGVEPPQEENASFKGS